MNDPREEKLPKWARHELEFLRRDVENLSAELRRVVGREPTSVVSDPHAEDITAAARMPLYLDPHRSVRFKLADHKYAYVDVRLKEDGTELELMASGPLVLHPQVTNVMRMRLA